MTYKYKEDCNTCRYICFIMNPEYRNRTDTPCFLCKRNISDNRAVMYEPIRYKSEG